MAFPFSLLGGVALGSLLRPLFRRARATDEGEISKEVKCEACGCRYVYQLYRAAQGRAPEGDYVTAANRACNQLTHLLLTDCDPVPCPECGWYQRQMLRRARQLKYRGLFHVSLILVCAGANLLWVGLVIAAGLEPTTATPPSAAPFPSLAAWCVVILVGAVLVVALALPVLKLVLSRRYDPNAEDVETRKQLGRSRASVKRAEIGLGTDGQHGGQIETHYGPLCPSEAKRSHR